MTDEIGLGPAEPRARFPSAVPGLAQDDVVWRELGEQDIPSWFARATDAESADLAGDPVPPSIDLGTAWLQRHRDRFRQGTAIRWAIVPAGSPVGIGTVGLSLAAGEAQVAELGIVVARSHWGRGIGTTATRMAVGFGFSALDMAEVRAEVLVRNPASMRMLVKAGFRQVRLMPASAAEPEAMFLYALARSGARAD